MPVTEWSNCPRTFEALRSGIDPEILIEQLKGIRYLSTIARRKDNKNIDVLSRPDAIARALEAAMGRDYEPVIISSANKCPDCSCPLRREAGCNVCDNCGYTKCGWNPETDIEKIRPLNILEMSRWANQKRDSNVGQSQPAPGLMAKQWMVW